MRLEHIGPQVREANKASECVCEWKMKKELSLETKVKNNYA